MARLEPMSASEEEIIAAQRGRSPRGVAGIADFGAVKLNALVVVSVAGTAGAVFYLGLLRVLHVLATNARAVCQS